MPSTWLYLLFCQKNTLKLSSTFYLIWDIGVVLITVGLAVYIPIFDLFYPELKGFPLQKQIFISLFFLFDIILMMYRIRDREGSVEPGIPRDIEEYWKTWGVFDIIPLIPLGLILGANTWGLVRLVKLVRVVRIIYSWRHRFFWVQNHVQLFFVIFSMLLATHWVACGWLQIHGIDQTLNQEQNYIEALYWSVSTISTVGYGDIVPVNRKEKLYAVSIMILGWAFWGYLIGYLAGILSKEDPAGTNYRENLERLAHTVKTRDLPYDLQRRIYEYYTYIWQKRSGYFEQDFLRDLPDGLKREVSLYLKKDVLEKVPLFKGASDTFLKEVCVLLQSRVVTPGELIVKAGEEGKAMFFILRGELEVIAPDGETLGVMKEGDYFGEIALFTDHPRTATLKAINYCDLYSLNKHAFDYVIKRYPEISKKIEKKVRARVERTHSFEM